VFFLTRNPSLSILPDTASKVCATASVWFLTYTNAYTYFFCYICKSHIKLFFCLYLLVIAITAKNKYMPTFWVASNPLFQILHKEKTNSSCPYFWKSSKSDLQNTTFLSEVCTSLKLVLLALQTKIETLWCPLVWLYDLVNSLHEDLSVGSKTIKEET
jgi:hypothetical protein